MAISDPVAATALNSTANGLVYDGVITGSLAVDDVVLVFVHPCRLAANSAVNPPTLSKIAGTSTIGSFTQIGAGMRFTSTDHYGVYCFWVRVTGAGTLQVRATFTGGNYAGCRVVTYPLRGTHLTTPVPAGNISEYSTEVGSTDPTHTLPSVPRSTSWCFESNAIRRNPPAWTPDATNGWVEDFDLGETTPAQGGYVSHTETGGVQSVLHSGTNGTHMSIMFEVQEPIVAAPGPVFPMRSRGRFPHDASIDHDPWSLTGWQSARSGLVVPERLAA